MGKHLFLDDNDKLNEINGHKVIGNIDSAKEYKNGYDFFVAIGDNYIRQKYIISWLNLM